MRDDFNKASIFLNWN